MSLTTALSIAQSALRNTARQTSVVSRNVADASSPDYSRRIAITVSNAPGARSTEIQRATNELLFKQNLSALSAWSGQGTLFSGMDRLGVAVNGVNNASSPATIIGKLQQALQTYSASPSNTTLASTAIEAARDVVRSLNSGTAAIQSFRAEADGEIATAVSDLNGLLTEFQDANNEIKAATIGGRDASDALDRRDALLKKISEYVPVTSFTRSDNDMVLMTRDGTTLFETVPRAVSFTATSSYSAGTTGGTVLIDGVPVGGGTNGEALGKLAGLVQLRDNVATTMQSQLDEIARGLITAFAETDQTGGAAPARTGLFTWAGAPAVPAAGTLVDGLAGTIRINAAFDPNQGGNATLLRDGGANGAAYVANAGGGAAYADLLISYSERLDAPMVFDAAAGIGTSGSVSSFSTTSIGWFDGVRKSAASAADAKEALAARTTEALSNETGVNVDNEMALLLDLEHAYEASARLMKAVDDMLASLMAAVR